VLSWVSAPNTLDGQVMAQAPATSTTRPPYHPLLHYYNRHATPCAIGHGYVHLETYPAPRAYPDTTSYAHRRTEVLPVACCRGR
jgi:hypothetical protein